MSEASQSLSNDHASNFQLAFGHAREVVQYFVLKTVKYWKDDCEFEGQDVPRGDAEKAYSAAPEDLKLAIDWQLQWDSPSLIQTDAVRRSLEYHRRQELGDYEEILAVEQLEQMFDVASPAVQHAVVCTYSAWRHHYEGRSSKPPARSDLQAVYNSAPAPLKNALCYVLELGLTYPLESAQDIEAHNASIQDIVDWQRSAVHRWESSGVDIDVN